MTEQTPRIRVDFNRRNSTGQLIGSLRRFDGTLRIGDALTVYQAGEDMCYPAIVEDLNTSSGRILLKVEGLDD